MQLQIYGFISLFVHFMRVTKNILAIILYIYIGVFLYKNRFIHLYKTQYR